MQTVGTRIACRAIWQSPSRRPATRTALTQRAGSPTCNRTGTTAKLRMQSRQDTPQADTRVQRQSSGCKADKTHHRQTHTRRKAIDSRRTRGKNAYKRRARRRKRQTEMSPTRQEGHPTRRKGNISHPSTIKEGHSTRSSSNTAKGGCSRCGAQAAEGVYGPAYYRQSTHKWCHRVLWGSRRFSLGSTTGAGPGNHRPSAALDV